MKLIYTILLFLFLSEFQAQKIQVEIDSLEKANKKGLSKEEELLNKASLSLLYFKIDKPDLAYRLYETTLTEAKNTKQEKAEAQLYHNMASMNFYQYYLDSAIHYFQKALGIRKRIKDNQGTLKSISNIAAIYFMQSDFKNSLNFYKEGLKLESDLGYAEGEYIDLNNMALAFSYLKLYDKSLGCYRKSEKMSQKSPKHYYTIYSGIGMIYKEKKLFDSALYYSKKALEIAIERGDSIDLAYSYSDLGLIYHDLKDYTTSRTYFNKALHMSLLTNEKHIELASWANIAAYFIETKQADSADSYIEKTIALQKELNIQSDREDLSRLFAEYYYHKKDYIKSHDYFEQYDHYKDSLYQVEASARLIEFQEKFDAEKKEKENQLLQIENKSFKTSRNYLAAILLISLLGIIIIFIAYRKILSSRKLLSHQKELIVEKQKEILDSIHYAKRIQYALLASDTLLNKHLPEHFVLFKPKDVVSGDFYWAAPTEEGFVYITGDCTGHGVPGAFMSLLLITKLNQAISENKIHRPDLILNNVRDEIVKALNPEGSVEESKDGMDAVLCKLNLEQKKLEFAAANNSFYIIRKGELLVCKADKMPVGKGMNDAGSFTYNEIQLQTGDVIYTFTDGLADQFGGPAGKKFKYKQLETLLLSIYEKPMADQKELLDAAFESWRGNLEQVDDVCILGVKIN